jgi:hypothetical protein
VFFEAQFGLRVQFMAQRDHFGFYRRHFRQNPLSAQFRPLRPCVHRGANRMQRKLMGTASVLL